MAKSKTESERRYLKGSEVRAVKGDDGATRQLVGRAVVYNSLSEDLCGFREIIKPGAFTEALKTADLRALIDHNSRLILGRQTAGTLRVVDGPDGLDVAIDLPDTSYSRDLLVSLDREDITGMSFLFDCIEDEWLTDKDGQTIRTVIKALIHEVSVVTFPAYPDTSVALRSLARWQTTTPHPGDDARKLRQRINESLRF
jgi:HK97 family phage prohead protease